MLSKSKNILLAAVFACFASACPDPNVVSTKPDAGVDALATFDASTIDQTVVDQTVSDQSVVVDSSVAVDMSTPDAMPDFNVWEVTTGKMNYQGGPVMVEAVNVYFIWYGDWKNGTSKKILEDLITGFNNSDYSWILTDYYQLPQPGDAGVPDGGQPKGPKEYVNGQVRLAASVEIGYTHGNMLLEDDIQQIVADEIGKNTVPSDKNGIYFVLTSVDVQEGGFCSVYCGWHNNASIGDVDIKYSFIGDASQCLDGCTIQTQFAAAGVTKSPNDNWGADGMASVIIHELSETLTDPDPIYDVAWQDGMGYENGDKCAWRFEPTYVTNESRANIALGARNYLIQQMWILDNGGGHCGLFQ